MTHRDAPSRLDDCARPLFARGSVSLRALCVSAAVHAARFAMSLSWNLRRRVDPDAVAPADGPQPLASAFELQALPEPTPSRSGGTCSRAADVDVEHLPVQGGDPRDWMQRKKLTVFGAVA